MVGFEFRFGFELGFEYKSMTEALETQVKSKVSIKGHLHTYRFCDNVWTFILQNALFKNEECQETVGRVKIVGMRLKATLTIRSRRLVCLL